MPFQFPEFEPFGFFPTHIDEAASSQLHKFVETFSPNIIFYSFTHSFRSADTGFYAHQFIDQFFIDGYCGSHTYLL